ncbi:hypothetical protein HCN44_001022 [Aphidius gifuensis]|uniref:Luciferin 4-monooxygenase n=2 Tax=Aphidius gifuensis TaxID=684658 RepID=A0A834XNG0_APHGI|nr:hypothetical protein HCN44_001022 [Aphidius gifuensis]
MNQKTRITRQTPSFKIENGIIKGEECSFMDSKDNNFGEMLLENMKKNSSVIGQVDVESGKEDPYGEMADRSIRCALWMKNENLKPGDVIAICTNNHLDSIIPCLASLYTGVIFNPWWDHGLTKEIARHFINLTKPKVLFTNEDTVNIALEVSKEENINIKIIVFGCTSASLLSFNEIIKKQDSKQVENFKCNKFKNNNQPAFITYTSGTTGFPKGVLHSHKSLFGNIRLADHLNHDKCIALCYSTLCWITGIICPFLSIAHINKRIVANDYSPKQLCQLVEKYKINWILMGTSPTNRLLTSGEITKHDLSSIEYIWIGGAVLKEESQKTLQKLLPSAQIIQLYGMTEFGGIVVHQTNDEKLDSIGTIAKNLQMKIIDPESGKILGPNETGEACFKSPHMMIEYYNNPEKTKEAIDTDGWMHTGDLCYYDENGFIFIIDRLKELIKWRGHHVSPAIVEQLIQTIPGVTEAAVVAVADAEDDERPFAFVAKIPDTIISEEDVKKLVQDNLPDQMRLRGGVKFLNAIPHTASGKINRTELKKIASAYARKS